jgi:mRNA-degrading endonuclease RelE of RelBE toxin-antitoxin system
MLKEIVDHFQRSPVTIGEAIMKVEDLLKRDKLFEKALKSMEENLVKVRKRKYRVSVAWP